MKQEPDNPPRFVISGDRDRAEAVRRALDTVTDPEIPVVTVVEMGMIAAVRIEETSVVVDLTPTFAGCPALDVIRQEIRDAVARTGERHVVVNLVYDPPWTSDAISQTARRKLTEFGLAPPRACGGEHAAVNLEEVPCPHCRSTKTDLESVFGSTLCRSIHYCRQCLQSFEHFKEV